LAGISRVPVVIDINVLVDAVVAEPDPSRWESPPAIRGEASAMTLAILNEGLELEMWLSGHLIDGALRVLSAAFSWTEGEAEQYRSFLESVVSRAGGRVGALHRSRREPGRVAAVEGRRGGEGRRRVCRHVSCSGRGIGPRARGRVVDAVRQRHEHVRAVVRRQGRVQAGQRPGRAGVAGQQVARWLMMRLRRYAANPAVISTTACEPDKRSNPTAATAPMSVTALRSTPNYPNAPEPGEYRTT